MRETSIIISFFKQRLRTKNPITFSHFSNKISCLHIDCFCAKCNNCRGWAGFRGLPL